ncbi:MAG: S24/S26 family peptidase [Bacteroidaceae bacterium]
MRIRREGVHSPAGRQMIPNEQLFAMVSEVLSQGHTAVIWVKGYSMRPFLEHERDRVKLAAPKQVKVGDAVMAQIAPGHYVLHRIINRDGIHVTLQGDGNLVSVEHCLLADICGVVIEYIRPKRVILASDPTLRRRIRIWRRLRPMRRLLLFLYRATLP